MLLPLSFGMILEKQNSKNLTLYSSLYGICRWFPNIYVHPRPLFYAADLPSQQALQSQQPRSKVIIFLNQPSASSSSSFCPTQWMSPPNPAAQARNLDAIKDSSVFFTPLEKNTLPSAFIETYLSPQKLLISLYHLHKSQVQNTFRLTAYTQS